MDTKSETITQVTIPIPLPFQRNYGVNATTHHSAERATQRYRKEDIDLITRQAAKLEITVGAFIKESAINMAKALAAMEKDNAKHDLRSG